MKKTLIFSSLVSSLYFTAFDITATETESVTHQIDYGLINFDRFLTNAQDLSTLPSIVNYTYYFSPLVNDNSPYQLGAELSRTSWLKTNGLFDILGLINVNGRQFFNNGYDIEYQVFYDTHFINDSFEDLNLNTGFMLNFPTKNNWQFGIGFRNVLDERTRYYDYDGNRYTNKKTEIESQSLFRAQAINSNIKSGKGWYIKGQAALGVDTDGDAYTFDVAAEYFHSPTLSTSLSLVASDISDQYSDERNLSILLSQKYWFSYNTAIKYGISFNQEKDTSHRYDSNSTENNWLYELSGTWRF